MNTDTPPLLAVVGPTASGKGTLARAVARLVGAELLSVDSMKVYRGMDVGTAKPSAENRAVCPHHLLDLVDPRETFSVAHYLAAAEQVEADIRGRGRLPLFVGGTALYLKSLRYGLFEDVGRDPDYRAALEREADRDGGDVLHARLAATDPEAAGRIHPNDRKRVIRALEVLHVTGQPISELQTQFDGDGRPARWVGMRWPREVLNDRINRRVNGMLAAGLLEEVRRLEAEGAFGPTSGEGIGYRELRAHLAGECGREEAVEAIKLRTRQFARRQVTWFRSFGDIHWLDLSSGDDPAARAASAAGWLGTQ